MRVYVSVAYSVPMCSGVASVTSAKNKQFQQHRHAVLPVLYYYSMQKKKLKRPITGVRCTGRCYCTRYSAINLYVTRVILCVMPCALLFCGAHHHHMYWNCISHVLELHIPASAAAKTQRIAAHKPCQCGSEKQHAPCNGECVAVVLHGEEPPC